MIVRVAKRDHPFVVIQKSAVQDKSLTWRARGLLAYLLSKPDDWTINRNAIADDGPEGVHTVRGALQELEAAGYLQRVRVRVAKGRFRWESILYETPEAAAASGRDSANGPTREDGSSGRSTTDGSTTDGDSAVIKSTDDKEQKKEKDSALAEALKVTKRQIRGVFVAALGGEPTTEGTAIQWNVAIKHLAEAGLTPMQVQERIVEFRRRWPHLTLSPKAIDVNWDELGRPATESNVTPIRGTRRDQKPDAPEPSTHLPNWDDPAQRPQ